MSEGERLPRTRLEAKRINSEYYFTAVPCRNGHISARLTSNAHCRECLRVWSALGGERRAAKQITIEGPAAPKAKPAPKSQQTPRTCLCRRCEGKRVFFSTDPPAVNRINPDCARLLKQSGDLDIGARLSGARFAS